MRVRKASFHASLLLSALVPLLLSCAGRSFLSVSDVSDAGDDATAAGPPADASTLADATFGEDAGTDAAPSVGTDGATVSAPEDAGSDTGNGGDAEARCWEPTLDASAGSPIAAANVSGSQDVPAGVTPNASAILVQRGPCSAGLSLFIIDRLPGGGTYESRAVASPAGMNTSAEENATLSPDGLSIIAVNSAYDGFLVSSRTALGTTDFGVPVAGAYAAITTSGQQTLWAPSLSADGLAFYYVIKNDPAASVNGIYESIRGATNVPFPPGTRMPTLVQGLAQYVNGLSADRLTIYLEGSTTYATYALTRASVNDPFANPLAPNSPPTVPGLRTRPLTGCQQFIGSCQPAGGGCLGEEVCVWGP